MLNYGAFIMLEGIRKFNVIDERKRTFGMEGALIVRINLVEKRLRKKRI